MAGIAQLNLPSGEDATRARIIARNQLARRATSDPLWMKATVLILSLGFLFVFFVLPLALVFQEAFRKGWEAYLKVFEDRATTHSIWLTLKVALIAVPLNTVFGLAAAWCVAHFRFRGKQLLSVLIELPLWVSPVVAGLIYVLLFGRQGLLGPWLFEKDIKIIFALPGIVLSTVFVTFPFVARVVTPQLQALGRAEEEAALTLGANGWSTFWRVTVPKIKWSLIYGIILCNARAMGEFGAVSVVSGHIRNQTNTMPLHIEVLYNEYQFVPAFAVASLLALLALLTLVIKSATTWFADRALRNAAL
ncbi:sulfate ABC transporter permease subunit CysW [Verrucomicrobium sp. BvORR034]|jgi:sulfate transport system permease protein|uniref:sulfate ABC transporter permease subunit CysW n=1 Tax=Verrucomicrobium sp. BvORR034 TaxID=1396418 RepID=UPI000A4917A3|nr:sulfate ABC transporter permease subunit CysW [Verrucomicrobium sp. BvORR034]